jgi:mono/diheme cytochrome c family protein
MRSFSFILKQFSRSVLLIAGFAFLVSSAHAQADAAKGEALFKANCTACHKIEVQVVGPALGPTITDEKDDKFLVKWIQNNQALMASGDQKAKGVYNKYNQAAMTVFTQLSEADVMNIITYARTEWANIQKHKDNPVNPTPVATGPSTLLVFSLIGIILLAFVIIIVLNKVTSTLERLLLKNKGLFVEEVVVAPSVDRVAQVKKLLKNKKFVFFILLVGTLALGSWTWESLWNTNVHTGYQPVQPIKYSHELHAGIMKIECQYCHSGAYKSKNASIPSLNICMNCHKVIDRGLNAKEPSVEIKKIYDALGYDPSTQKYDTTKAHPIQWIRIHNLPDLAYFNHSQHTKVGNLKCQTCHGPIQEMKEVYQYSPLTMKWCIQCHKRTNVDFKGNAYYTNLEQVHKLLSENKKVTAAMMGGIECGKCHY